jgi:hypothetical protein
MKVDVIKQLRNSPDRKKLLTIQEAAALCGFKDDVISEAIKSGDIKVFSYFTRSNPKIPMNELDNFIEKYSFYQNNTAR